MNTKKIIFFAYDLDIGGIETALLNLLNNLNYDKYDVSLILEYKRGINLEFINKNVKVIEYNLSTNKIVILRKIFNFIKRFIWTLKNKNKYDFSCAFATYSKMGCKLAKIASQNNSIYIHSDYFYVYNGNERNIRNFFDERGISEFKKIVFVSENSRQSFLKYYPSFDSKTYVINNFIDDKRIIKLADEKIEEKKEADILFTYVGRLDDSVKKVNRIIYTIKKLNENNLNCELIIVGSGPDEEKYKKYVLDNNVSKSIKFVGKKSNPYPYMKMADYIVLCSDYEGFPVTYLEAITLQKKIITTIDVTDNIIKIPLNYGYIVSKDEEKMYEEILEIIRNDKLKYSKFTISDYLKNNKEKLIDLIEKK